MPCQYREFYGLKDAPKCMSDRFNQPTFGHADYDLCAFHLPEVSSDTVSEVKRLQAKLLEHIQKNFRPEKPTEINFTKCVFRNEEVFHLYVMNTSFVFIYCKFEADFNLDIRASSLRFHRCITGDLISVKGSIGNFQVVKSKINDLFLESGDFDNVKLSESIISILKTGPQLSIENIYVNDCIFSSIQINNSIVYLNCAIVNCKIDVGKFEIANLANLNINCVTCDYFEIQSGSSSGVCNTPITMVNCPLVINIDMLGCEFKRKIDFGGSTFLHPPKLFNSILHEDTNFSGARFVSTDPDDERAYRTLKFAMESHRARVEQNMFFALEQDCRRKRLWLERDVVGWFISLAYKTLGDYGQSVGRPVGFLLLGAILSWLVTAVIVVPFPASEGADALLASIGAFTVEQTVRPFWFWVSDPSGDDRQWLQHVLATHPFLMGLLSIVHSLFTILCVALFLIGLRRRFHMG